MAFQLLVIAFYSFALTRVSPVTAANLDYCKYLTADQLEQFDCPPADTKSESTTADPKDLVDESVMEEICPSPPCEFLPLGKALTGGAFEGDINGIDETTNMSSMLDTGAQANAIRDESKHWPNATVPYVIGKPFTAMPVARKMIMEAMEVFHKETCVRFKPRTTEKDYLYIAGAFQCSSYSGKTGNAQLFQLSVVGCLVPGIIQHELMHSLGFYHEQSRSDRDDYVDINYANLLEKDKLQFQKYQESEVTAYGEPYDFGSVLHYAMYDFAKDPKVWTIRPKPQYASETSKIGQRITLSPIDIKKINAMYKCQKAGPCPRSAGWTEYGNGICYFFSFGAQEEKMTYVQARNYCRKQGNIMGSPSDDVISDLIIPEMKSAKVGRAELLWLEGCRTINTASTSPDDADTCDTPGHFICQRKIAVKKSKKFSVAA